MTKMLSIPLLILSSIALSQESEEYRSYVDSTLAETKLVYEVDNDKISSLMIFSYVYENGYGEAKGFFIENNIPVGTIDNDLSIPACDDSSDVRMEILPYSDSLFILKYKWKQSTEFVTDTCYLFHYSGNYVAYAKNCYDEKVLRGTWIQWFYGPASTDDRDVIQICTGDGRKTIFFKL